MLLPIYRFYADCVPTTGANVSFNLDFELILFLTIVYAWGLFA